MRERKYDDGNELEKADKANTWLDYFVKYQDIEELSRTVVVELIRQIRVYDKKNIEITFDFDDCYQTCLLYTSSCFQKRGIFRTETGRASETAFRKAAG